MYDEHVADRMPNLEYHHHILHGSINLVNAGEFHHVARLHYSVSRQNGRHIGLTYLNMPGKSTEYISTRLMFTIVHVTFATFIKKH